MRLKSGAQRLLASWAIAAAALSVLAIFIADGPLAVQLASLATDSKSDVRQFVSGCEVVFGFRISPYLFGGLAAATGLTLFFVNRGLLARSLLFLGLTHLVARFGADILKPPFSRLRPFESIGADGWHDTWFAAVGNSFPSGHAAHFWSLCFPLMILFPKYRFAFLILPVLVSAARVAVNDHYLSDVLASAAFSAAVALAFLRILGDRGLYTATQNPI